MYHLEAVVAKRRSQKAVNPPPTFRHTSCDIKREFVRESGSSSRSIRRR
jgi:hypothetical protein